MILPTIHSNGTSRDELLEVRREAYSALNTALRALEGMSPNGRDYYINDNIDAARRQHQTRLTLLSNLQAEILAEYEALDA